MHPVRHRAVLGPAHGWGLVWLVALAVPVLSAPLRNTSAGELGLLELSPPVWPEMPLRDVAEAPADVPGRDGPSGRDPFTAPMSAPPSTATPSTAAPICGASVGP